jgi:acetate kinase
MSQAVLVINSGSSSLKFALLEASSGKRFASGSAERLSSPEAFLSIQFGSAEAETEPLPNMNHAEAFKELLRALSKADLLSLVFALGHRVVHGGGAFTSSHRIDEEVLATIESVSYLAPLHNPLNLAGIRAALAAFPELPHVAVFDTAFHQTLPEYAYRYAVPRSWYEEHGVRKYGFHGTSHRFVARAAAEHLGRDARDLCLMTAHLGNGCSACAIDGGKSVETTMGLTPLSGLVMGTRSGDLDPGIVAYLSARLPGGVEAVDTALNRASGLLGLSGSSNDMRTLLALEEDGDQQAKLAIDVFCYRLAASLCGLAAALPRLDALIFTGGIGERAPAIRRRVMERLWSLGVHCDEVANQECSSKGVSLISTGTGPSALVVPTDEEWMISHDTIFVLNEQVEVFS